MRTSIPGSHIAQSDASKSPSTQDQKSELNFSSQVGSREGNMKNSQVHLPGSAMEAKHLLTWYSRKPPSIVQARPGLPLSVKASGFAVNLIGSTCFLSSGKFWKESLPVSMACCICPQGGISLLLHLDFCSRPLGSNLWPRFRIWSHHETQTCIPWNMDWAQTGCCEKVSHGLSFFFGF